VKKPIYYAIVGGYNRMNPSVGQRVMAVTLEKGRQVYGRWADDEANTHCSDRDVRARFETLAEAQNHLAECVEIHKRYEAEVDRHLNAIRQLERDRDGEWARYLAAQRKRPEK
jgi:hypothetical protein